MQLHKLACRSLSLYAVLSLSEQLTRILQCLFASKKLRQVQWLVPQGGLQGGHQVGLQGETNVSIKLSD